MLLPPAWLGPCPQGKGLELRAQQSAKDTVAQAYTCFYQAEPIFPSCHEKSLGHGAGELKFYTEPKIPQSHRWSQEPDIQTILESDGSGCKAMGF